MIAASPEPEDDYTVFAEPLPYLHHFNEELVESGHEPLFREEPTQYKSYDVIRPMDFRSWPEVAGMRSIRFDKDADVPESRIRVIGEKDGKLIHECYERVNKPIASNDTAEIMRLATAPDYYWKVTYRLRDWREACTCPTARLQVFTGDGWGATFHEDCGQWRESRVKGNMGDHVASLTLGMPDEEYNGYYSTIPGNDIAHHNPDAKGHGMEEHRGGEILWGQIPTDNAGNVIGEREPIRGGTEIRGGRAEHRTKTKGMIAWDNGTQKDLDKIKAEKKAKLVAKNREFIERKVQSAPRDLFDV